MFNGRNLLIATKHHKEKVIAPILEKELGVKCIVSLNFDTDELGTFTGEIERKNDPITTARNKCEMAMELANCDLAIASEGSFGPHPSIFFATADDEFLLFLDKRTGLEIIARELSLQTNFNGSEIKSIRELKDFARKASFPTHGLILRKNKDDFSEIKKGITDWDTLLTTYTNLSKVDSIVYVETDMRAMFNPTRMQVIKKATEKLVNKINTYCPQCNIPGFDITSSKQGLPCGLCNSPTRSILSYLYTCKKCGFAKEEKYPNGKTTEEPMYCDNCNP